MSASGKQKLKENNRLIALGVAQFPSDARGYDGGVNETNSRARRN
jgi:hypothetical protein